MSLFTFNIPGGTSMEGLEPLLLPQLMFLLQIDHPDTRFLTIAVAVLGGLMGVLGWFFKRKIETYDKHLEECGKRAADTAAMNERTRRLGEDVTELKGHTEWISDSIITIGARLGVTLPPKT